jgi:hypothetical protein
MHLHGFATALKNSVEAGFANPKKQQFSFIFMTLAESHRHTIHNFDFGNY